MWISQFVQELVIVSGDAGWRTNRQRGTFLTCGTSSASTTKSSRREATLRREWLVRRRGTAVETQTLAQYRPTGVTTAQYQSAQPARRTSPSHRLLRRRNSRDPDERRRNKMLSIWRDIYR